MSVINGRGKIINGGEFVGEFLWEIEDNGESALELTVHVLEITSHSFRTTIGRDICGVIDRLNGMDELNVVMSLDESHPDIRFRIKDVEFAHFALEFVKNKKISRQVNWLYNRAARTCLVSEDGVVSEFIVDPRDHELVSDAYENYREFYENNSVYHGEIKVVDGRKMFVIFKAIYAHDLETKEKE